MFEIPGQFPIVYVNPPTHILQVMISEAVREGFSNAMLFLEGINSVIANRLCSTSVKQGDLLVSCLASWWLWAVGEFGCRPIVWAAAYESRPDIVPTAGEMNFCVRVRGWVFGWALTRINALFRYKFAGRISR